MKTYVGTMMIVGNDTFASNLAHQAVERVKLVTWNFDHTRVVGIVREAHVENHAVVITVGMTFAPEMADFWFIASGTKEHLAGITASPWPSTPVLYPPAKEVTA